MLKRMISMLIAAIMGCNGFLTVSYALAPPVMPVNPNGDKPMFTGSSSNHTLLLSHGGTVSAWGNNSRGQCGAEGIFTMDSPNYIHFNTAAKIVQVAAGGEFSLALDEDGYVWGWGDNASGQLGVSDLTDASEPQKLLKNIEKIAAGEKHAIALDKGGNVWSWGANDCGQLGRLSDLSVPAKIEALSNVKDIATKFNHNLAVDKSNQLWTWGDNSSGQLGRAGDSVMPALAIMPEDGEIVSIATGKSHSAVAISRVKGQDVDYKMIEMFIYSFGDNSKSQLGVAGEDTASPVLTKKLDLYEDISEESITVRKLLCGENRTALVGYCIDQQNKTLSSGFGYYWGDGWHFSNKNILLEEGGIPAFSENLLTTPQKRDMALYTIDLGYTDTVAYYYLGRNVPVMMYGANHEDPMISYVLEVSKPGTAIFEDEYNAAPYYDYKVNFVELDEAAFANAEIIDPFFIGGAAAEVYTVWEYVDAHHFRAKPRYIRKTTLPPDYGDASNYRPAFASVILPYTCMTLNKTLYDSIYVWNFDDVRVRFALTSPQAEIPYGQEDGISFTVQPRCYTMTISVSDKIKATEPLFFSNPYPLNDDTALGLYVYGLPKGVTASVTKDELTQELTITLAGAATGDLDYDLNPKITYLYSDTENPAPAGKTIGDFDKNSIWALTGTINDIAFKAAENTPEVLSISADTITLGKENGATITATISGGEFNERLTPSNWRLTGCEDTVQIEKVTRVDNHTVILELSGASEDVYTADRSVTITCTGDEYADSREPDEFGGYVLAPLTSENLVTFTKQNRPVGGGVSQTITPPAANPKGSKVVAGTKLELTTTYKNAQIYYTIDGSTPTANSTPYTAPITIDKSMTVKYIVIVNGKASSVASQTYMVDAPKIRWKNGADKIRYIRGYEDGTFKPDMAITRYEMLESLAQILDIENLNTNKAYPDVSQEKKELVGLFTSAGIVEGFDDGLFRGDEGLTRAEFVKIMSILLELDTSSDANTFSDIKGHWAEKYIMSFGKSGYLKGYEDGTFRPDQKITRAEFTAVVNRIINASSAPYDNIFSDVPSSHWAFAHIMKAYLK